MPATISTNPLAHLLMCRNLAALHFALEAASPGLDHSKTATLHLAKFIGIGTQISRSHRSWDLLGLRELYDQSNASLQQLIRSNTEQIRNAENMLARSEHTPANLEQLKAQLGPFRNFVHQASEISQGRSLGFY